MLAGPHKFKKKQKILSVWGLMQWCPNLGAASLLVLSGDYLSAPSRSVGSFPSFRWAAFTHVQRLHSTSQFTEDMVTVICRGHMIPIRTTHQSVPVGSQEVERSVCCQQEQRFVSFGVKNKVFFHNKLSQLQIWIKPRRKSLFLVLLVLIVSLQRPCRQHFICWFGSRIWDQTRCTDEPCRPWRQASLHMIPSYLTCTC